MSRVTGIDHLIIATEDLQAATSLYGDVLGFHVSGGGSHPQFGTANRIIVLGDEYIELLAGQPGADPSGLVGGLLRLGEGCAACILGVRDMDEAAEELRSRGLLFEGPTPGRLEAGPQFSRGWKTLTPVSPTIPGVPFLIEHDSLGEERRRLLAGQPGLADHSLGARRVDSVTIAVNNCAEAAGIFDRLFDITVDRKYQDPMLGAECARLHLASGAGIVLAMPMHAGEGPIAAALAARGEGLFALTIDVVDLGVAVRALRARGIGVRVDEPEGVLVAAQLNHRNLMGARIGLIRTQ